MEEPSIVDLTHHARQGSDGRLTSRGVALGVQRLPGHGERVVGKKEVGAGRERWPGGPGGEGDQVRGRRRRRSEATVTMVEASEGGGAVV